MVVRCCQSHSRFKFPGGQRQRLMHLWTNSCPQNLAWRLTRSRCGSQMTEIQHHHDIKCLPDQQRLTNNSSFLALSSPQGCFSHPACEPWSQRAVIACFVFVSPQTVSWKQVGLSLTQHTGTKTVTYLSRYRHSMAGCWMSESPTSINFTSGSSRRLPYDALDKRGILYIDTCSWWVLSDSGTRETAVRNNWVESNLEHPWEIAGSAKGKSER